MVRDAADAGIFEASRGFDTPLCQDDDINDTSEVDSLYVLRRSRFSGIVQEEFD